MALFLEKSEYLMARHYKMLARIQGADIPDEDDEIAIVASAANEEEKTENKPVLQKEMELFSEMGFGFQMG